MSDVDQILRTEKGMREWEMTGKINELKRNEIVRDLYADMGKKKRDFASCN